MEQKNRLGLRANFRTGDRPTQEDFEDVFESYLNFADDGVSVDENRNVTLDGAIVLGNGTFAGPVPAGTIRWSGGGFEGHDGTSWGPIGGGGESPWQIDGANLIFPGGNIGIGIDVEPTYPLEVEVTSAVPRVRLGNTTVGNGFGGATRNNAVVSHSDLTSGQNYALMQNRSGTTYLNCPTGQKIEFRINNFTHAAFDNNNLVVGANSQPSANVTHRLQVAGGAYKDDGQDTWDITSDIRTKKDIQPFQAGLDTLRKIDPIKFKYNGKANTKDGLERIGISAQQLEQVFPAMVTHSSVDENKSGLDTSDVLTANLSDLKFIMLNAIKELDKRMESLEKKEKTTKKKA